MAFANPRKDSGLDKADSAGYFKLILCNFTIDIAHYWGVLNFFKRSALKIGWG